MDKKAKTKVWLASPTMHGEEQKYVDEAFHTNWVSTVGENIDQAERIAAEKIGRKYAVALSSGTAALHLGIRLCGEKIYGKPKVGQGALAGHRVFCSDLTFGATVNPVVYEGGEPVFIDSEYETWNMDPEALELAFLLYPDVRLVVVAHLYGTPAKMEEIQRICKSHNALLVEDAAESFGASCKGIQTGMFGTESMISFEDDKIITGSSGGMLLTDVKEDADRVRKWSTQSREAAPWCQHEELGYDYRMSNIVAGVVRGQLPYLEEHIAQKKAIYMRYKEAFADLPVRMNPYIVQFSEPNFRLSCILIDRDAMCRQVRSDTEVLYLPEPGKSCPAEILEHFDEFDVEGCPIWKPMHMQPMYRLHEFVTRHGSGRGASDAYIRHEESLDVGEDIFARGLCLPSDIKMTEEQQETVIEIVRNCFA